MTAALFLAVVLSCAGDPMPGTLDVAPPPPQAAAAEAAPAEKVAEKVVEKEKLDTLEPDVERPRRPRPEPIRSILLEMLVVALELVINH